VSLTIVMYHYVRDLARSRYPAIKGRTVADFRGQLDHIGRNYEVVTAEHVAAASRGETDLPANAAWLTFDDGYLDHFTNVTPLLDERGWQGSFFVPARPVLEGKLLDVNKIHFILASGGDPAALVDELRQQVAAARERGAELRDWDSYLAEFMGECHLDTPEVLFIKLMLQVGLPEQVRTRICDALFARFVSSDEVSFAAELYASPDQLRMMQRAGMCIGSHGFAHNWMGTLPRDEQAVEVSRSLEFLASLGVDRNDWVMCYPYGSYNADTLDLVRASGCALGVTTGNGIADIKTDAPLELPRIDTIDLPVS
jgi:peptidoglycan/xylan/chitin deacetylase (PgdA/CDA1 family)